MGLNKQFISTLTRMVTTFTGVYLFTSFILLDFNCFNWDILFRVGTILVFAIIKFFIYMTK